MKAPAHLDYRATSTRPAWGDLPRQVRSAVEAHAGAAVVEAAPPVTSGFTGSYAGQLLLADGRRVFAKAAGPTMPHVVAALTREAMVLHALPAGIPSAALVGGGTVGGGTVGGGTVGGGTVGGWSVLVLDALDARMPGMPWTAADVDAAHRACLEVAAHGTPCPPDLAGGTLIEQLALELPNEAVLTGRIRALEPGSLVLSRWAPPSTARLLDLCTCAPELLSGETLVHGDLRPDNMLVDRHGRAFVVDWNWVSAGPAWADFAGLWPLMARDGIDVRALAASSPLTDGVPPDAVDAFLSLVAIYMLSALDGELPPGCTPALRAHQRLMGTAFLTLLAARREW